jgi:hypothetical protein
MDVPKRLGSRGPKTGLSEIWRIGKQRSFRHLRDRKRCKPRNVVYRAGGSPQAKERAVFYTRHFIRRGANPLAAYLVYLSDIRGGLVGDMFFTLADFKAYIYSLRENP